MGSRYTPPKDRSQQRSPLWLVTLIISLILMGLIIIIVNQVGSLPGGTQARYLFLGFGLFVAGFFCTTQLR